MHEKFQFRGSIELFLNIAKDFAEMYSYEYELLLEYVARYYPAAIVGEIRETVTYISLQPSRKFIPPNHALRDMPEFMNMMDLLKQEEQDFAFRMIRATIDVHGTVRLTQAPVRAYQIDDQVHVTVFCNDEWSYFSELWLQLTDEWRKVTSSPLVIEPPPMALKTEEKPLAFLPDKPPIPNSGYYVWNDVFDWFYRVPRHFCPRLDDLAVLLGQSKRTVERYKGLYDAEYSGQPLPDSLSLFT